MALHNMSFTTGSQMQIVNADANAADVDGDALSMPIPITNNGRARTD